QPANLVLVAWSDAASGRADGSLRGLLVEPFFLHVVGENDVGVIAQYQVVPDGHAGLPQRFDFFQEARRGDDHTVSNHRARVRPQYARREKGKLEAFVAAHARVSGVGPAIEANHKIVLVS